MIYFEKNENIQDAYFPNIYRKKSTKFWEKILLSLYIFWNNTEFCYSCFSFFFLCFKKSKKKLCAYFLLFCNLLMGYFSCQQNSFRRTWTLEQALVFTGFSSIQFFDSFLFSCIKYNLISFPASKICKKTNV